MTAWSGYNPACGCESGCAENWSPGNWSPGNESNPFVDDELRAPPEVPKDARAIRETRPVRRVDYYRVSHSSEPGTAAPVVIAHVDDDDRSELPGEEPIRVVPASEVVRHVRHESAIKQLPPKNPLRDE